MGLRNPAGSAGAETAAWLYGAFIPTWTKSLQGKQGWTILFGLTGTGYFDMYAYEKFHDGKMTDYIPTDEELQASFATLPKIPE